MRESVLVSIILEYNSGVHLVHLCHRMMCLSKLAVGNRSQCASLKPVLFRDWWSVSIVQSNVLLLKQNSIVRLICVGGASHHGKLSIENSDYNTCSQLTQLTSCINSFRFCVFFTWPSSCDWSSNDDFIFYILLTTTIKWSDKHKGSFSVSLQGNSLCLLLKKGPLDRTNTCPCINTTTSTYTGIFESNYKEKELRNRPTDLATKNQTR